MIYKTGQTEAHRSGHLVLITNRDCGGLLGYDQRLQKTTIDQDNGGFNLYFRELRRGQGGIINDEEITGTFSDQGGEFEATGPFDCSRDVVRASGNLNRIGKQPPVIPCIRACSGIQQPTPSGPGITAWRNS